MKIISWGKAGISCGFGEEPPGERAVIFGSESRVPRGEICGEKRRCHCAANPVFRWADCKDHIARAITVGAIAGQHSTIGEAVGGTGRESLHAASPCVGNALGVFTIAIISTLQKTRHTEFGQRDGADRGAGHRP